MRTTEQRKQLRSAVAKAIEENSEKVIVPSGLLAELMLRALEAFEAIRREVRQFKREDRGAFR